MTFTANKWKYLPAFTLIIATSLITTPGIASSDSGAAAAAAGANEPQDIDMIYREQCRIVDEAVESPQRNIQAAIDYTVTALQDRPEFKAVHERFSDIEDLAKTTDLLKEDWFTEFTTLQQYWAIGFSDCFMAQKSDKSPAKKAGEVGSYLSYMMTPDCADPVFRAKWKTHPYPLISRAIQNTEAMANLVDRVAVESVYADVIPQELPSTSVITPCLLPEPHNAYHMKTFFYALSKSVSLVGIGKSPFTAHGKLFRLPCLATAHDFGHEAELFDKRRPRDSEERRVAVLKEFSKQFLALLDNDEIIAPTEKEKAVHAAFLLIHETQIKEYTESCILDPDTGEDNAFTINLAGLFRCPREHKFGFEQFQRDYPENFTYRFYAEFAFELVKFRKDLKRSIFPWGKEIVKDKMKAEDPFDSDNGLPYDIDRTIDESIDLVFWLQDKIISHLKPVTVSPKT